MIHPVRDLIEILMDISLIGFNNTRGGTREFVWFCCLLYLVLFDDVADFLSCRPDGYTYSSNMSILYAQAVLPSRYLGRQWQCEVN